MDARAHGGDRPSGGETLRRWLPVVAVIGTAVMVAHMARTSARTGAPAGERAVSGPDGAEDVRGARQRAWIMERRADVRAQSSRPELKAVALAAVALPLTGAGVKQVLPLGLPTRPVTGVLTLILTVLATLMIYHLSRVLEATIGTGVGFTADAIPPAQLRQRMIDMADNPDRQIDEAITETSLLSQSNVGKYRHFNKARTTFVYGLIMAGVLAAAAWLTGW